MTFIPLLGYYLLRPDKKPEASIEERRTTGFTGFYASTAKFAIEHRWKVAIGSLVFLLLGGLVFSQLKTSFFPDDVQYWSYIDVWLPNDANFDATNDAAQRVEKIIREQAVVYGKQHPQKDGSPSEILKYVTTWVGGGGPRFWFSANPQAKQLNYAQVLVQVTNKDDHARLCRSGAANPVEGVARRSLRLPPAADQPDQLSSRDSRGQRGRRQLGAERAGHYRDAAHRRAGGRHCEFGGGGAPRPQRVAEGKLPGHAEHQSRSRQSGRHHESGCGELGDQRA